MGLYIGAGYYRDFPRRIFDISLEGEKLNGAHHPALPSTSRGGCLLEAASVAEGTTRQPTDDETYIYTGNRARASLLPLRFASAVTR